MSRDRALGVNSQEAENGVLIYTDGPEKSLGRCRAAFYAYLFLHAADHNEKPFPAEPALGEWPLQQIFLAPKALTAVNHDLCLSAEAEKEYRRSQDDPVGPPDIAVYFGHIVGDDAFPALLAAAAILAGLYPPLVQVYRLYGGPRIFDAPDCFFQQEVCIALFSGASQEGNDVQGISARHRTRPLVILQSSAYLSPFMLIVNQTIITD